MDQDPRQIALERALSGAGVSVDCVKVPAYSEGHVPVTDGQWRSVLCDAGLTELWSRLLAARDSIQKLRLASPAKIGQRAPRSAKHLLDLAEQLVVNIEGVSWFRAPEGSAVNAEEVAELGLLIRAIACEALGTMTDAPGIDPVVRGRVIMRAIEQETLRPSVELPSTVVAKVFGVSSDFVEGLGGLDTGAKLRVASRLDTGQLEEISRHVLGHLIPDNAAYPPSPTGIVPGMLLTERPLAAHVAALNIRELLLEADSAIAAEILDQHQLYMPANWATHRSIETNLQRLRQAEISEDDEDAALAQAELSWAVTEGPVRRVAWTVLRLCGAEAGPLPGLAELLDRLRASDNPVAQILTGAIESAWRNSVAHRDVAYDAGERKLVLGGVLVDPQGLRARRAVGDAVNHGFECGVALARASSSELARCLDLRVSVAEHPQIVESRLADQFAHHGMVAERIRVMNDRVVMEFLDGTVYEAAGVIAELAASHRDHEIDHVELRFGSRSPLTLTAATLAEVSRLCHDAGGQMPATAMWPIIALGRLQLGVEAQAAYSELAERAAWAAMRIVAPRLGIKFGSAPMTAPAASDELEQILRSLLSAWRVLPGRAPAGCVDIPQRIRIAKAALTKPERLFTAGKALHEACSRDEPPHLPWFAPLQAERDAA